MYLLDTDTIIYNFKGHAAVQGNLRHHLYDPLKISVVTLMELYYGAYKSQKTASNLAKLKTLENSLEIITLGKECVEIFGMLKANLEKSGTPLDDFDLILASCALTHNLILVTNNVKHFQRIEGLKITNWTEPAS
ncbi:MAG TPA: type II toxin-antitoxin system VapC family toxin [Proteobacteria bacterium]|jgi:predicted nucleic acid-binding protein|nr:type II toxin-antitoxin system VapC family toxin [Pseudomonadota bacterium]